VQQARCSGRACLLLPSPHRLGISLWYRGTPHSLQATEQGWPAGVFWGFRSVAEPGREGGAPLQSRGARCSHCQHANAHTYTHSHHSTHRTAILPVCTTTSSSSSSSSVHHQCVTLPPPVCSGRLHQSGGARHHIRWDPLGGRAVGVALLSNLLKGGRIGGGGMLWHAGSRLSVLRVWCVQQSVTSTRVLTRGKPAHPTHSPASSHRRSEQRRLRLLMEWIVWRCKQVVQINTSKSSNTLQRGPTHPTTPPTHSQSRANR